MEDYQYDGLIEVLTMIETNTRKTDKPLLGPSTPDLFSIGKVVNLVKKDFFAKLDAKTGWGRNEIKQMFIESIPKDILAERFSPDSEKFSLGSERPF